MATREPIMTALLATCATAANFQTVTRIVVNDPQFGPTVTVATPPAQPALILVEDIEHHVHSGGHGPPTKRTMGVMLMIWALKDRDPGSEDFGADENQDFNDSANLSAPDYAETGATLVNTLLEAVEAVLVPDNAATQCFTLGGLVQRCWIEGTVTKVSGDLDPNGQAFLAIPLSILIP